jgi:hypothetical protein
MEMRGSRKKQNSVVDTVSMMETTYGTVKNQTCDGGNISVPIALPTGLRELQSLSGGEQTDQYAWNQIQMFSHILDRPA